MGTSRFVVRNLDETDADAVFTWAGAACRTFPLAELLTASERDSGVEPTLDAVVASFGRTFPQRPEMLLSEVVEPVLLAAPRADGSREPVAKRGPALSLI
jgi:hypothetical protein